MAKVGLRRIPAAAKAAGVFDNPVGQGIGRGLNWMLGENASSGSDAVFNRVNAGTGAAAKGLARAGLATADGVGLGMQDGYGRLRGAGAVATGGLTGLAALPFSVGKDQQSFGPNYLHNQAIPMVRAGLQDVFGSFPSGGAVSRFNENNIADLRASGQTWSANVGETAGAVADAVGPMAVGAGAMGMMSRGANAMTRTTGLARATPATANAATTAAGAVPTATTVAPGLAARGLRVAKGTGKLIGGAMVMDAAPDVARAVADEPESDPALEGAVADSPESEPSLGGAAGNVVQPPHPGEAGAQGQQGEPVAPPTGDLEDPRAGVAARIQTPEFQEAFQAATPDQQQEMLRPVVDELMPHAESLSGRDREALMAHVQSDGKLTLEDVQYLATTVPAGQEMVVRAQKSGVQDVMGQVFETIANAGPGAQAMMALGAPLAIIGGLSMLLGEGGLGSFLMMLLGGGAAALGFSGQGQGMLDWAKGMLGGGQEQWQPAGGGAPAAAATPSAAPTEDFGTMLSQYRTSQDPNDPGSRDALRALADRSGMWNGVKARFGLATGNEDAVRAAVTQGVRAKAMESLRAMNATPQDVATLHGIFQPGAGSGG